MTPILYVLSLFLTFAACQIDYSDRPRNFSLELLHYTALQTDGHVVISPFGVWTLMNGVALGATGESYQELRKAFILPKNGRKVINGYKNLTKSVLTPVTPEVSLTSKNFMFLDQNFNINQEFKIIMQGEFDAAIKTLDFNNPDSAAKVANGYIQESGAKVSNVLTSDDFAESRMILTNAISFKGLWGIPFNESDTKVEKFYNDKREPIGEIKMMYQRGQFPFSNVRALQSMVLELPYGNNGKYSMLLVLPHPYVKVSDVYPLFATTGIKDLYRILKEDADKYGLEDVDVRIPRFKISTNVVLNKPLNDMGVYQIFDPVKASFGRVTKEALFVSAIVHKADIEVTESGTVASASTSADFADRISTPTFAANRPFIYFVMEKSTTTMIFGGIYSKPTVF